MRPKNHIINSFLTVLLLFFFTPFTYGAANGVTVNFSHTTGNDSIAITATPGTAITINIKNTCKEYFTYTLGGVPFSTRQPALQAADGCKGKTHTLTQIHDEKYGGYYINVVRKPQHDAVRLSEGTELENTTFLILVNTIGWDVGFGGGFVISELTDPVFASMAQDDGMGNMQNIVIQDNEAEDDVSLGLAAMVHIYHQNRPNWALTFGMSVDDDNGTSYMAGPSYRFGDKAALTLGYQWGSVDRLPSGLAVGDVLTDTNSLQNLGERTEGGVFLSFSYSFVPGIKDLFTKKFKGQQQGGEGASVGTEPDEDEPEGPFEDEQ